MEDIVAVALTTTDGQVSYFVTWGRIQDPVDPEPLERVILDVSSRFAIQGEPLSARLCRSLRDARDAPYFYEALFAFAQKPIPFGPRYQKWRRSIDKAMREGKEISFVGPFKPSGLTQGADSVRADD